MLFPHILAIISLVHAQSWDYCITNLGVAPSSANSATWASPTIVSKSSLYQLNVRVLEWGSNCPSCQTILSSAGASPVLVLDQTQQTYSSNQSISSTSSSTLVTTSSSSSYWAIPIKTSSTPGILKFTIKTANPTTLLTISDTPGQILVNWMGDQTVGAGYTNSLAISSSNLLTSSSGSTLTATRILIRSLVGGETSWNAILTTSTSSGVTLLASPDEYKTIYQQSFSISTSVYGLDICSGAAISSLLIEDVAYYDNQLFLLTNAGLILGAPSSSNTLVFTLSSPTPSVCLKKMNRHLQTLTTSSYWNPLVLLGGTANEGQVILFANQSNEVSSNLLDSSSLSMKTSLFPSATSITIIDSVTSSIKTNNILFLVLVSSTNYYLVNYDLNTATWTISFCFPTTVPPYTSSYTNTFLNMWNTTSSISAFSGYTSLSSTIPLTLTSLATTSNPSTDVFVLGNALFYSPNFGISLSMIQSLSSNTFSSFASHFDGEWASETSDYQLWFGNIGVNYMTQASVSRTSGSVLYTPYFDFSGSLYELSYNAGSLSRTYYNTTALVAGSSTCLYSNLSYVYQSDLQSLASLPLAAGFNSTLATSWITSQSLPSDIYLDYLETFSFQIRVIPTSFANAASIILSLQESNSSLLSVTYSTTLDYYRSTVVFNVVVTDLGVARNTASSPFLVSSLRISLIGDTLSCNDFTRKTITVYSGCHPTASLQFSPYSSGILYPCPYSNNGIPCAIYTNTFSPQFYWIDSAQNLNASFADSYSLTVVKGGQSLTSMTSFTTAQQALFNPSSTSSNYFQNIWVSDSGSSTGAQIFNYASSNTGIEWKCMLSSPCHYMTAPVASSPSIYYLTMQVTVQPSTALSTETYCQASTQFQVALVGIPFPFPFQIATILSTFLFSFFCLGTYMYLFRDKLGLGARRGITKHRKVSFNRVWPVSMAGADDANRSLNIFRFKEDEDDEEDEELGTQQPLSGGDNDAGKSTIDIHPGENSNQDLLEKEWYGEENEWNGEKESSSSEEEDELEELQMEMEQDDSDSDTDDEQNIPLGGGGGVSASLASLNRLLKKDGI